MTESGVREVIWSTEVDEILSCGNYLGELGVKNWALSKKDAQNAISALFEIGVPILGGDVYYQKNSGIYPGTENWYHQRSSGETIQEFLIRSTEASRAYVMAFNSVDGSNPLFALVPS